jgi:putative oligomerization/nucleic acid binding protein
MVFAADYPFLNILGTMAIFFLWTIWIVMMVQILSDVFRRRDLSGGAKVGWTVFLIVVPFIAALIYLAKNADGLSDRRYHDQVKQADFSGHAAAVAADGGSAGEIAQAKELLDSGAITQVEFEQIKTRALA